MFLCAMWHISSEKSGVTGPLYHSLCREPGGALVLPATTAILQWIQPLLRAALGASEPRGVVAVQAGAGEPGLPGDKPPRDGRPGTAGGVAWLAAIGVAGAAHAVLPRRGPSHRTPLALAAPGDVCSPGAAVQDACRHHS